MALHGDHGFQLPMFRFGDILEPLAAPTRDSLTFFTACVIISVTIPWLWSLFVISIFLLWLEVFTSPVTFLQNASMFILLLLFYFPVLGSVIFTGVFFNPFSIMLAVIYLLFFMSDLNTPNRGGRPSKWFKEWRLYDVFRDYFPIRIIKTADLDPTKNYMFGYHPHGFACLGIRCFVMEALNFRDLFPGIESYVLTLEDTFSWPLYRDYLMATGFCSVSKESISYLLSNGTGKALINAIGGIDDIQEAYPGSTTIALSKRKGFVKICLQHGASLVPVYAFGENDVFSVINNGPEGTHKRELYKFLRSVLGYSPIFAYARGFFPYRTPINVVVGAPIDLPKTPEPTNEQIQQTHDLYIQKLLELFDTHKAEFGYEGCQLNII